MTGADPDLSSLSLERRRVGPGGLPPHRHDGWQVVLPLTGGLDIPAGRDALQVLPGGGALIPPDALHGTRALGAGPADYLVLDIGAARFARLVGPARGDHRDAVPRAVAPSAGLRHVGLAAASAAGDAAAPAGLVEGLSMAALSCLLPAARAAAGRPWIRPESRRDWRVRRTLDAIEARYADDLRVGELAELVGLSAAQLTRLVRTATGLAPYRHLTLVRVEQARRLLLETRLPVVEVAARVGFESQSRFTTVFRRVVGLPPAAFRHAGGGPSPVSRPDPASRARTRQDRGGGPV